jgi:hypothetical protein
MEEFWLIGGEVERRHIEVEESVSVSVGSEASFLRERAAIEGYYL